MVTSRERQRVLDHLMERAVDNLLLIEMVASLARSLARREIAPRIIAAWQGDEIVGVISLRPSIVVDYEITEAGLDACLAAVVAIESGLVKSPKSVVDPLWDRLRMRGRHALIDRIETTYTLSPDASALQGLSDRPLTGFRPATMSDLEDLVYAARASLREERRPDPFDGDPTGFRRWVAGRVERARVVEADGRVVFVGYADVRRPEGWLIQGVYTWPEARRKGFGTTGMLGLINEAFSHGTDHVQLAVVEGNAPGIGLYCRLGFEPFRDLRTILFI
jgi:ribosomal protein S18 acetylase RimI-like enzyme